MQKDKRNVENDSIEAVNEDVCNHALPALLGWSAGVYLYLKETY